MINVSNCDFTCSTITSLTIFDIKEYELNSFTKRPALFRLGEDANTEVMEFLDFEPLSGDELEPRLRTHEEFSA